MAKPAAKPKSAKAKKVAPKAAAKPKAVKKAAAPKPKAKPAAKKPVAKTKAAPAKSTPVKKTAAPKAAPKPKVAPAVAPAGVPDLETLHTMDWTALDILFDQLRAPKPAALKGFFKGKVLTAVGLEGLPAGAAANLLKLMNSPLSPWRGKRTDGEHGANVWFADNGPEFARFAVAPHDTPDNPGQGVVLNYHVDENPVALRPIRGEVKQLGPGLFLGRMSYLWRSEPKPLIYFTLEA